MGIVVFGRNLAHLDAFLLSIMEGSIYVSDKINRKPIMLAQKEFGAIDQDVLLAAKMKVGDWIKP
jgi:hypothetical protein